MKVTNIGRKRSLNWNKEIMTSMTSPNCDKLFDQVQIPQVAHPGPQG